MTADEFANAESLPEKMGWMACHFSPYTTGLCNLPEKIPANSLLILNDSTPPRSNDPKIISKILKEIVEEHNCFGILLDFQQPYCPESQSIIEELIKLEFPVCVSECYARNYDCPVFLPPLPLTLPLAEFIEPWIGREIWLEAALSGEKVVVTEKGSAFFPISLTDIQDYPHKEDELHCHYLIESTETGISFSLQRTKEDLDDLLAEAETLGVTTAVGLYQELK